jgi:hypothetical protein
MMRFRQDLTLCHQEEEPEDAIHRMKEEYAALKAQYMHVLALRGGDGAAAAATGSASRKRANDADTGLRRKPNRARRIDTTPSTGGVDALAAAALDFEPIKVEAAAAAAAAASKSADMDRPCTPPAAAAQQEYFGF